MRDTDTRLTDKHQALYKMVPPFMGYDYVIITLSTTNHYGDELRCFAGTENGVIKPYILLDVCRKCKTSSKLFNKTVTKLFDKIGYTKEAQC